ncbi:AI-2 transport protein TqsA [Corynebacterium occultum]|uniref:AI-2 transport protein TqsA n=1 Tax=Corynebacterium occultum TaxID=2675219 RepID=A0A6B8WAV4_9CORY|nr:AI-2E family transporter [Corynebacterium occultum]QGU08425.1 AI-2 transport protein TqsA [Corynebacterium occultum]
MNERPDREKRGLDDGVPDEVTHTESVRAENSGEQSEPAALEYGEQAIERDLPGIISYAVEGTEEVFDDKDNPRTIDRAAVIGRDGRWVAGWALRFIIMVIAAWIFWQGLSIVWAGLLPILLALLVSTVLWPVTKFLRDHKWPAALAAITTILTFFLALGGIFTAIAPSVASQSQEVYQRAYEGIQSLMDYLQGEPFNLNLSQVDGFLADATAWLQDQSSNIASGVFSGFSAATTILVTIVVMFVLTFFFLKDGVKFLPWLRKYTGETAGWHLTEVLSRSWNTLAGFIRTQALVSFVDAVFIGVGLLVLQVPMALALAVITFFAGFIPIVGAFTAGALAVIIALVTNGFTNALLVLGLIVLVQQIEGNILQPFLQGRAMQMHAAIVLLSVTVGSTLFGILGAFLAVPVAAVFAVWFRYHAEMVSLRSGEITVDDIKIETARGAGSSTSESFTGVRDRLISIGRRKSSKTAPGAPEEIAEREEKK